MPAVSVAQRKAMAITDWAYLAGFLDGEGYITIRRSNRGRAKNPAYRLVVGFTSTHLPVLQWIRSYLGGCINPKSRKSERHAPAFELTLHNRGVQHQLLNGVQLFVQIKSAQVELGLAFLALGKVRMRSVPRGKTWPLRSGEPVDFAVREEFKQRLGVLNQRGPTCLQ